MEDHRLGAICVQPLAMGRVIMSKIFYKIVFYVAIVPCLAVMLIAGPLDALAWKLDDFLLYLTDKGWSE